MSIEQMRLNYTLAGLDLGETSEDPLEQFRTWFEQAKQKDLPSWMEVNAMTLSTADEHGVVSSRIVLLKGIEGGRFVFYTNYQSAKGRQILANPSVSLCFYWPHVERQVRIEGTASKVDPHTSDAYFRSRPRESQIGAWASEQSRVIASRSILETQYEASRQRFLDQQIQRPENWGGYQVEPLRLEFWQGRPSRLHDRIEYQRSGEGWTRQRVSP